MPRQIGQLFLVVNHDAAADTWAVRLAARADDGEGVEWIRREGEGEMTASQRAQLRNLVRALVGRL